MFPRFTAHDLVSSLIEEERRPPSWRWQATARHDDLVAGLWEWQADASREGTMLARELIQIEQNARYRWPTKEAVIAADDNWWKRRL